MKYTLNNLEKGKVEIKVDIPKADFEKTHKEVVKSFAKDAKIPGFRPGMAPGDVVEGHVGANKVLNESASFLISTHLSEILKKEDIIPLDSPQIAVDTLAVGSPFSFNVKFTKRPKVTLGAWKGLKVKKITAKEVTEKDVEESIKNIHEAYQKQKEAGGTKETEESKGQNIIYDSKGNAVKSSSSAKAPQNKEAVKIDDDFAKAIGANDLAHLREIVKKDLESLVANQVETQFEQEIFEKMAELGTVEVPELLVEDELNRILVRLNSHLEQQSKTLDEYLKEEKTTIEELKAKWREQAEKNVKTSLIMDAIGKEEKVQVTREELEAAMARANTTDLTEDQKKDLENYMVSTIFQAKTLDHVKKAVSAS